MKVPKNKYKVNIVCLDGTLVKGFLHVLEGQRIMDFINNNKEDFIAITNAEFSNVKELHSFKLYTDLFKNKKAVMLLNKSAIKWIREENS